MRLTRGGEKTHILIYYIFFKLHKALIGQFILVLQLQFIVIIIVHSLELFTAAIADGFSLKSEWQQVSSSLQDSS